MLPLLLDIKGKKIAVFGGGNVAVRRIEKLLKGGAIITLLDRDFPKEDPILKNHKINFVRIDLEREDYLPYLNESDLIFISTDNKTLNDKIRRQAKELDILVNRADGQGDFIIPGELNIGDITITISTGGRSPAMTKHLKQKIKECITKEDLLMIELQEFLRERLITSVDNQKKREKILTQILHNSKIIQLLSENDLENAKKYAIKFSEVI